MKYGDGLRVPQVPPALSAGVKRPGREGDHGPPSGAEVKKEYA